MRTHRRAHSKQPDPSLWPHTHTSLCLRSSGVEPNDARRPVGGGYVATKPRGHSFVVSAVRWEFLIGHCILIVTKEDRLWDVYEIPNGDTLSTRTLLQW